MRGILKYCVRGMLGDCQQETLILFMDAIASLCAPHQNTSNIDTLKEKVAIALARVERDFPVSLQVINIMHLKITERLLNSSCTFSNKTI